MERVNKIMSSFAQPNNIYYRLFTVCGYKAAIIYHKMLTDSTAIRDLIAQGETSLTFEDNKNETKKNIDINTIINLYIPNNEANVLHEVDECVMNILGGMSVIVIEGVEGYISVATQMWSTRGIAEPPTETVLHGPREGFNENYVTILSLIERKLKSPNLVVDPMVIGKQSNTNVAIVYLNNIADKRIVKEIKKKLQKIKIDGVLDSSYIQFFLERRPNSIFKQTGYSEKPDVIAAKLLEGRIAIVVDGSPLVLTYPFILEEDFQSSDDYYDRSCVATGLRLLRHFAILVAILLPGLYVAIQLFHNDLIPLSLLINLIGTTQNLPLSPMFEMLLVLLLFEIIREASVRMPNAVSMAMSIVGGLVLGQTAVNAGIISSNSILIVALSSITLYTVPNQVGSFGIVRLLFVLAGGIMGIFGIILGVVLLIFYLTSLDSFGVAYLAPFAPFVLNDIKDSIVKNSLQNLNTRPESIPNTNEVRLLNYDQDNYDNEQEYNDEYDEDEQEESEMEEEQAYNYIEGEENKTYKQYADGQRDERKQDSTSAQSDSSELSYGEQKASEIEEEQAYNEVEENNEYLDEQGDKRNQNSISAQSDSSELGYDEQKGSEIEEEQAYNEVEENNEYLDEQGNKRNQNSISAQSASSELGYDEQKGSGIEKEQSNYNEEQNKNKISDNTNEHSISNKNGNEEKDISIENKQKRKKIKEEKKKRKKEKKKKNNDVNIEKVEEDTMKTSIHKKRNNVPSINHREKYQEELSDEVKDIITRIFIANMEKRLKKIKAKIQIRKNKNDEITTNVKLNDVDEKEKKDEE